MNLDTQNNASEKKLTAIRAIRKKCLLGKNTNITGRSMSEEQKQAARERLQKIREGA